MRRTIGLATAVAVMLSADVALAAGFHEGTYIVQGTNLDGSHYGGTAKVRLLSDTTCSITWTTGSTSSSGVCMLMDGILGVAYSDGSAIGVVMYKINADGSLDGVWTVAGKNGSGTEHLSPR